MSWPSFMLGVLVTLVAGYLALAKVRYDDERDAGKGAK